MIINENKLKKIIKNILINNFILKENLSVDRKNEIEQNWINLFNENSNITFKANAGENTKDAAHRYISMYGINDLAYLDDMGLSFFNNLLNKNEIPIDKNKNIIANNIFGLYHFIYEHYINVTNLTSGNKDLYVKFFKMIHKSIEENMFSNDIAFTNNFIKISEACKKTGIWNKDIIQKEMLIIAKLTIDDLKNFTENEQLQSQLKKNYPAEIIFSNLRSRNVHLINLLSKEMNNETVNHIVKRLKSTIAYRRKKQNK